MTSRRTDVHSSVRGLTTPSGASATVGVIRYLDRAMSAAGVFRPSRWHSNRAATALLVGLAALLVLGLGACGSAHAGTQTSGRATASGTGVSVTAAPVGSAVPNGFVGISIEEKALTQFAGTNPKAIDPVLLHLLGAIAPQQNPVLRIGGDSTDWSWWPVPHMAQPGGVRFALTPQWMSVAHALAADLQARLILGVNLEADSGVLARTEAQAMLSRIGRQYISALELGNEPELYGSFGWYKSRVTGQQVPGRPRSYDFANFIGDFAHFGSYLAGDPLAGPSMGGPVWLEQLGSFVKAERHLNLVTVHAYPLKHCTKSTVVTSAQLLSDAASHGLAERVAPWVREADGHHLPLRIDEMNGISCGGTRGVSDTFTSALWVLDTLFEMVRTGVAGVNIHTVPGTINEVLGPSFSRGHWSMRVHPEFYGMAMFAQAAPAGARLLRVSSAVPAGVKVWATRARDGTIHVVVINKRAGGAASLSVRVASATGPATSEQLRAPNLRATSGVTLGGQTFGSTTGVLQGSSSAQTVTPGKSGYSLRVPAASATLLTIPAP